MGILGFVAIKLWSMIFEYDMNMIWIWYEYDMNVIWIWYEYDMNMIWIWYEYDMHILWYEWLYMNIIYIMNIVIIFYHDISVNICQPTLSIRFQLWWCCWEAAVNWSIDPTSCCQVILLNSNLETNCIGWSENVQSSARIVVRLISLTSQNRKPNAKIFRNYCF